MSQQGRNGDTRREHPGGPAGDAQVQVGASGFRSDGKRRSTRRGGPSWARLSGCGLGRSRMRSQTMASVFSVK